MSYEIKFENNMNKFNSEWKHKKKEILYGICLKWQEIATKIITSNGIVDTGRLRASLSFITVDKKGGNGFKAGDTLSGSSGNEGTAYVGSNVEYAKKQELYNKKGAFIRPAITNYRNEYEKVAKAIMKK